MERKLTLGENRARERSDLHRHAAHAFRCETTFMLWLIYDLLTVGDFMRFRISVDYELTLIRFKGSFSFVQTDIKLSFNKDY